jgi:hypothetical protein
MISSERSRMEIKEVMPNSNQNLWCDLMCPKHDAPDASMQVRALLDEPCEGGCMWTND